MGFDDAPQRFRGDHPADRFSGASGVLFEQAMAQTRMAICLCDARKPDLPIVFANRAFRQLTGYSEAEIIGRNCRFLQGPDTDPEPIRRIGHAIANEDVVVVELLNYRKDGTTFWNALHLGPIYNDAGELAYYFGSQWDVSDARDARAEERHARELARELSHRMKNMFAVISGIVNVTGRVRGFPAEAAEIDSRIQTLARAYAAALGSASSGDSDIGDALRAVLPSHDRDGQRLVLTRMDARLPLTTVSLLALVLHELAVNAARHGAWASQSGRIEVRWDLSPDRSELLIAWDERGGPACDPRAIVPGSGTVITDRMLASAQSSIERVWRPDGLLALIRIPAAGPA